MKAKIFFAGNFEFINQPLKERKLAEFCMREFGSYDRLGSFFFKTETDKMFKLLKELKDAHSNKRLPGGRRKLTSGNQ